MIRMVKYLVLPIMLLILPANVFSQKILDYVYRPPDVRFDNFLVKDGEASQESISILIDSKGFVWSGTETALYRYDGIRYIEYGVNRGTNTGFKGFSVLAIFEDSEGTIWIGTSEALNRLDQVKENFQSYVPDPEEKTGVSNCIRSIHEDSDGLLWILTWKNIFSFDRGKGEFTKFSVDSLSWYPQNSLFFHEDQCFTEDSLGNKWFVTNHGLYRYSKLEKQFRRILPDDELYGDFKIDKVNCVTVDLRGKVWIGTNGGGLLGWDFIEDKPESPWIKKDTVVPVYLKDVKTILPDTDNVLWCFGNGSFTKYNTFDHNIENYNFNYNDRTFYEARVSNVWINQAFRYDDGSIWFLNNVAGLMFRFDPASEKLTLYRTPAFMVYQCVLDGNGSFWFACIRGNIFRLITRQLPFYIISNVKNNAHVAMVHKNNIIEDNSGRMWFLFLNGTYVSSNFDIKTSIELNEFRFPGGIKVTGRGFGDSKGNLWFIGHEGQILKYNSHTDNLKEIPPAYPPDLESDNIPVIREDKAGTVWLAHPCFGLYRLSKSDKRPVRVFDYVGVPREQEMDMMMDFLIDRKNNFWIITGENFLRIKMPEMNVINYKSYADGIFSAYGSNIRIGEDPAGNIWLLNNRMGLFLFNSEEDSFTKVDFKDEGPNSQYYDLLADRMGRIWIAHNRGITVFDPLNKTDRLIRTPKLQFDVQSYQSNAGQIIYVNNDQLYVFNEMIPVNINVPPVYITRLIINGSDYYKIIDSGWQLGSHGKLVLPHDQNSLSLEFAALNYINPKRNRYKYFMKGFDKDTVVTDPGQAADYKQLPPGEYRFWVTGSNDDGLWNPEGTFIDLRIKAPWYESFVAYLVYLIFISSAIMAYVKLRTYRLTKDRIRLEAEVAAATVELNLKNQQLEETDRIKTNFFTDISHEIRTPLSLIIGPLENISKEEMLSTRMSEMIALMKRNADRLMNLVNQLLDISSLDAGRMKIRLVKEDIIKCIKILAYEFLSVAESKQIKYIAELPEGSFITWFDRDKTEKILTNLLSNAFKYTPQKGTVKCMVEIKSDKTSLSSPLLNIRVIDNGPGINKEFHEKIFNKFFRVEGHHESGIQGSGIGLSLTSGLVSLLHGEINVISEPDSGAEFIVSIPLGKEHLDQNEYIISREERGPVVNQSLPGLRQILISENLQEKVAGMMKVLIVEDNEDLRDYLIQNLTDEYHVIGAENGKTGINTAFTMMPDLIVTDIIMPDIDGIELCKQVKNDERTSHIPIILLSAKATTDDKLEGLSASADDYLIKPFNLAELKIRISNLISQRNKLKLKYNKFRLPLPDEEMPLSVDDRFMGKVFRTINDNYRNFDFDVGYLQNEIGMSKTHLIRKLKILTGISPGRLIRNIRLEKAAELLLKKEGNITEIANSVGLSNPSYFTKSFRSYFGVTPKDYLKNLQNLS